MLLSLSLSCVHAEVSINYIYVYSVFVYRSHEWSILPSAYYYIVKFLPKISDSTKRKHPVNRSLMHQKKK